MRRRRKGRFRVGSFEPKFLDIKVTCYRVTGVGVAADALPASSPRGGRYHRIGEPQPFYGSLERPVAFAEVERHSPSPISHARLTQARVRAHVLDAFTPAGLVALGLHRRHLVRPANIRDCLIVAALAHELGTQGLLVPSAIDSSVANVVIWREAVNSRVEIDNWRIVTRTSRQEESTGTTA